MTSFIHTIPNSFPLYNDEHYCLALGAIGAGPKGPERLQAIFEEATLNLNPAIRTAIAKKWNNATKEPSSAEKEAFSAKEKALEKGEQDLIEREKQILKEATIFPKIAAIIAGTTLLAQRTLTTKGPLQAKLGLMTAVPASFLAYYVYNRKSAITAYGKVEDFIEQRSIQLWSSVKWTGKKIGAATKLLWEHKKSIAKGAAGICLAAAVVYAYKSMTANDRTLSPFRFLPSRSSTATVASNIPLPSQTVEIPTIPLPLETPSLPTMEDSTSLQEDVLALANRLTQPLAELPTKVVEVQRSIFEYAGICRTNALWKMAVVKMIRVLDLED